MKSFANTSRKLLWVSHVSFCPFFTPSSFRVFEFARVCVCLIWVLLVRRWLLKWYKLLSLCSALTLEVNHHNREIHNSWGANTRFPVFSEGHLKGRWNDSHEWWIQNCSPPFQKKNPVLINAGDVCWAEHMRCFCLFIIPTGNALNIQYIQPGTARGRKEHGS